MTRKDHSLPENSWTVPIPKHVHQIAATADKLAQLGVESFVGFTCLICGSQQNFSEPFTIYQKGQCGECNGTSDMASPAVKLRLTIHAGSNLDAILKVLSGK